MDLNPGLSTFETKDTFAAASPSTRFAATVAAFAQVLKGGRYTEGMTLKDVAELGQDARGEDPNGYRAEFVKLVKLADSLAVTISAR
ncbi:YfbK domain-containing protein [Pseudomonadota bacterium]